MNDIHALIEKSRPVIAGYFVKFGARGDDVEDLVQDTYLKMLRCGHFEKFDPSKGSFETYAYKVAWCVYVDAYRKDKRDALSGVIDEVDVDWLEHKQCDQCEEHSACESFEAIRNALVKKNKAGLVEVFELLALGLNQRMIGEALNLSNTTIVSKVKQIRDISRRVLNGREKTHLLHP